MTPDVIYDQLIGMGCARRLVFSWGGNPGVGSLHRLRDAVEHGWPAPLELEEHSHAGMAAAYAAGAARLPFGVLRGYAGTDLADHTRVASHRRAPSPARRSPRCRPSGPTSASSTRSRPTDVATSQLWGICGVQKEAVLAADRSLVTVEEVVPRARAPARRRSSCPAWAITAVAVAPGGAHPSYAHGYYDRDNAFYVAWDAISRDRERFLAWMRRYVLETADVAEYRRRLAERETPAA